MISFLDVPPTESTVFPGRCPEDTSVEYQDSYTWLPYKGNCYLFVTDEIEWADAASSCVRHGKISLFKIMWSVNMSKKIIQ